jgi:hypothetical protein
VSLGGGYMLRSREGHAIAAIGLGITKKTDGKSTHDAYSLFEYSVPARVDGEDFTLELGDYLYLPRDVVHTFRNPYDEESRIISVVSPAGLEGYYEALAEMPPGPKDVRLLKKIMEDFGIQMQLPPEVH